MNNPYQNLGEFSPFNLFPEMRIGEAFKKITCAGIDGRTKPVKQDIKEAIYTLNLIINDTLNYKSALSNVSAYELVNIHRHYLEVLNMLPKQAEAANLVLKYCWSDNIGYLKDAVMVLNDLMEKL